MIQSIDLNADLGESFGPWVMGNDAAMMQVISSANIACGFHAGDPDVMGQTMDLALAHGVALGAHPGFADLKGFGRRRFRLTAAEVTHLIQYQLGAAMGMAQARGATLAHFKLHGALSNMACEDSDFAKTCFSAALKVMPALKLVILPQTAMETAVRDLGAHWAGEIFADRSYCDDGTLTDRSIPGAMIHDPAEAVARILPMLQEGAIIAASGKRIPARIDTICVHGDSAAAVNIATRLRAALADAGIAIRS